MNYEHKYKKALERARSYYNNEEARVGMTPIDLEEIFPELKVSEDEKIRKAIIGYIEHGQHYGVSNKDMIAWLERQGEQDNWAEELNAKINELCLEIIQKYVSPCDGCNNVKGCVTCVDGSEKAYYNGATRQTPAWCEGDSFKTETLISVIKSGGSIRPELRDEFVNWLKSLRPQNGWKPSDEQMEALLWCVVHLGGVDKQNLGKLYEDLKKLKEE